jgi:hypothetical protein
MFGLTRGVLTLLGVAAAVVLIWLAAQVGDDSTADYWALYGLVAAGGLVMALSQLLGGWTKWGWPRVSPGVLLLGFLPAFVIAGWVVAAGQPDENWLQTHVVDWSDDLGLGGVVNDLLDLAGPLAFLAGLTFGFTFDTTGPRRPAVVDEREAVPTPAPEPEPEPEPRQLPPVRERAEVPAGSDPETTRDTETTQVREPTPR